MTRTRPSPALIVGLIALAVALSDTAGALTGKNTVDSGDIVNKQVKAADLGAKAVKTGKLAPDAVRTGKIADGTVTGADVAPNSITRDDLGTGAVWANELGTIHQREATVTVPGGQDKQATAQCLTNEQVISGGATWTTIAEKTHLEQSFRAGNGWRVWGANTSTVENELIVYAYCLQAPIVISLP